MSDRGSSNGGASSAGGSQNAGGAWRNDGGVQPHAFDPNLQPELFRGVLTRRVVAFLIDLVVLSVPVILGYLFIAVFGLITLGLGWTLFWLAWPASIIWAIVYYGASIGGLKVVTENAWFAARPSGTEDVYKIYAESFKGADHLKQVQAEAKALVDGVIS